jgi:folate-dependent phosphoribosylglycinamide formyltransferase PurN
MKNREVLVSMGSGGGTTGYSNGVGIAIGLVPGLELGGFIVGGETVGMVKKAERLKVPYRVVNQEKFRGADGRVDRYGFGQALIKAARELGGSVISQNGWLPYTPENFIDAYKEVIFNQHPGPKKETENTHGIQPHAIMLEFAKQTGRNEGTDVIIHRVTPEIDGGETVALSHVNILEEDTPQTLQSQALYHEYVLQILFWNQFMKGEVREVQDHVYMRPGEEKILRDARRKARRDFPDG